MIEVIQNISEACVILLPILAVINALYLIEHFMREKKKYKLLERFILCFAQECTKMQNSEKTEE